MKTVRRKKVKNGGKDWTLIQSLLVFFNKPLMECTDVKEGGMCLETCNDCGMLQRGATTARLALHDHLTELELIFERYSLPEDTKAEWKWLRSQISLARRHYNAVNKILGAMT
jgi:hypothetical protein